MGRHSSCLKQKLRKGLWSPEEDEKLFNHITLYGVGCWSSVPKLAGLQRCGKSCRLRWINYLRPDLKRGMFSQQEEDLILRLHQVLGNRWAQIAGQLPGRTDNEIKNFWNSYLKKKLMKQGIDPATHKPFTRDQIEVKSENSNSPTDTEPSLLPPSVIRPSEPAFLLGDPIEFPLQHGIGPNKAFFNLSPVLEFHRSVTSHPVDCSTSLLAGHRQCQDTSTRPSNVAGFPGMIGEESASSDGLASKMSSLFFDEAITTDDPRTNIIPGYQINSDNGENNYGGAFSWEPDCYNKLDPSSNQFQFDGVIKSDEALKANPWSHQEEPIVTSYNALDFGDYPLTSISEDFDVLQDL